jgi:SAM-dependent methyltransferase
MGLNTWFGRLTQWLACRFYPAVRYTSLMRALEIRLLVPWLRRVEGWHVLDVGCGHGFYSLDPARRGATFVGCDLDRPALASSRRITQRLGLDGRTIFPAADGIALPLPDQSVDLVVSNCVLEHIADDKAALAAMARVLRVEGILFLTVDNAEHGSALGFLESLPATIKTWLLWPEVASAATVLAGLDARLDELYAVLRRYRRDELLATLTDLGLTVLDSRPYLTGVGGAQYEAFHSLRILDPARGFGRLLYMLSSLLLYPLAAWWDDRPNMRGHGLAVVARKEKVGE